jgi:hypothetical protein
MTNAEVQAAYEVGAARPLDANERLAQMEKERPQVVKWNGPAPITVAQREQVFDLYRNQTIVALARLRRIIRYSKNEQQVLVAINMLLDRAWGKPDQHTSVSGQVGVNVRGNGAGQAPPDYSALTLDDLIALRTMAARTVDAASKRIAETQVPTKA